MNKDIYEKLQFYTRVLFENKDLGKIIRKVKKIKGVDGAFDKSGNIIVEVDPSHINNIMKQLNKQKDELSIHKINKKDDDLLELVIK